MKNLENVKNLFQDQESTKVISTVSKTGEIHSIVAGSIMVVDEDTLAVAEIFMNTTSANLKDVDSVALLAVKGAESYLATGTVKERHTEGAFYAAIEEKFAALNMPIRAIWTFNIDKIYNEGAGPDGGKLIHG